MQTALEQYDRMRGWVGERVSDRVGDKFGTILSENTGHNSISHNVVTTGIATWLGGPVAGLSVMGYQLLESTRADYMHIKQMELQIKKMELELELVKEAAKKAKEMAIYDTIGLLLICITCILCVKHGFRHLCDAMLSLVGVSKKAVYSWRRSGGQVGRDEREWGEMKGQRARSIDAGETLEAVSMLTAEGSNRSDSRSVRSDT